MPTEQSEQMIVRGYISSKQHPIAWSWLSGKNAKQAAQHIKYGAEAVLRMMSLGLQLDMQNSEIDQSQFESADGPIITPSFTISSNLFPSLYERLSQLVDNADKNSEILMLFEIWVFAVWGRTVGSSGEKNSAGAQSYSSTTRMEIREDRLPASTETVAEDGEAPHPAAVSAAPSKKPDEVPAVNQNKAGSEAKARNEDPKKSSALSGFQRPGLKRG